MKAFCAECGRLIPQRIGPAGPGFLVCPQHPRALRYPEKLWRRTWEEVKAAILATPTWTERRKWAENWRASA
jgi:hypothetical protein